MILTKFAKGHDAHVPVLGSLLHDIMVDFRIESPCDPMTSPTDHTPELSIVIPCLRQAAELRLCLGSLMQQDGSIPYEVIVVDSASDPQVEAAACAFPSVHLVRSSAGLSAGAARNLGIHHALAPVIGLIDADCVAESGWVTAAVESVRSGAVLAGGAILDLFPWDWIASSDNRLQFVDFPPTRSPGASDYFPGANLALARSLFDSLEGFRADTLGADDVIFTSSAAAGWPGRVRFSPGMVVRHHGRRTLRALLAHQKQFGYMRACLRLQMSKFPSWLADRPSLAWLVYFRRLAYISARVVQWNLSDLLRYVWQLPMILIGLAAWTRGFQEGLMERRAARR